ncbi:MAG: FHA domain-containing protein [Planctomycetes bacterium]|nr:FHA domain-containing protein [Planctomycetota bacterium]
MTVLALDWNATRVRAVLGPAGEYPLPVALEPPGLDLPLAIGLEGSTPEVGGAALRVCRRTPHLVCQNFLPFVTGTANEGPRWQAGRHALDARAACEVVWRRLRDLGTNSKSIVLTLPGYLEAAQADVLRGLGERGRLPVFGSLPALLAAALAGHAEQFWQRSVLVVDADDQALTFGWVQAQNDQAHLIDVQTFPRLGLQAWRERLIDALAEAFVWHHRRDPRDAPLAEQGLYDQLEPLLDAALKHQAIQIGVQAQQWYKHLIVHPEQVRHFTEALTRQAQAEAHSLLMGWPSGEARSIVMTHDAARLPGLVDALHALVLSAPGSETKLPTTRVTSFQDDDFGEALMIPEAEGRGGVLVLPPEAPARAAHALGEAFRRGQIPKGHLETIAPLASVEPVEAGPPRLHFEGHDYSLREGTFTIGTQYGCQLHFDAARHPDVAPRHCQIVREPRGFTLYNFCSQGTLVNEQLVTGPKVLQAGDRIRLSARGPTLRFLGKVTAPPRLLVRGEW